MSTWPTPLRRSTEVLDVGLTSSDQEVANLDPKVAVNITTWLLPKPPVPAPTKSTSPPGMTCRSYGGSKAWIEKRTRTSPISGKDRPLPMPAGVRYLTDQPVLPDSSLAFIKQADPERVALPPFSPSGK